MKNIEDLTDIELKEMLIMIEKFGPTSLVLRDLEARLRER